jgi:hypothetical protein
MGKAGSLVSLGCCCSRFCSRSSCFTLDRWCSPPTTPSQRLPVEAAQYPAYPLLPTASHSLPSHRPWESHWHLPDSQSRSPTDQGYSIASTRIEPALLCFCRSSWCSLDAWRMVRPTRLGDATICSIHLPASGRTKQSISCQFHSTRGSYG